MKITAVFCDAGATNLLAHYLKSEKIQFDCYAIGASKKILKKIFPKIKIKSKINKNILKNKILITTTSIKNSFEFKAKIECKKHNIKIISVLDHWINYKLRFKVNNKIHLPDEIWVFDKYAKKLSMKFFPKSKIIQKKNYYFEYVSQKINKNKNKNKILYICEGNQKIKNIFNYEKKNLTKIITKFKYDFRKNLKLLIKLHPNSKDVFVYKKIMNNLNFKKFNILKNKGIEDVLSDSKKVVGVRTYGLYLASQNSIKTFTLLEKQKIKKYIPYPYVKTL